MESILETLETADCKTLTAQFISILNPFSDFIPLDPLKNRKSHNKKKKSQITSTSVRPLANNFFPFLSKSFKLLSNLLRRNPSSQSPIEDERATELLKIYRLVIDCMSCISVCLVGNPNYVDLERASWVYCLEEWGKYEEAEKEGLLLIEKVGIEKGEGLEPKIVMLAAKVVSCVVGCAYKRKLKDGPIYRRNLKLVDQVLPLLRVLDTESMGRYHTLLVTTLSRCAIFLAEECISFDGSLVRQFCQKTLKKCLQSSSPDRFQNIPYNICKSIDKSWESRHFLILDMLDITLKCSTFECKVALVKVVNKFLEFVSYCVKSLSSASMNICRSASELLYKYGDDFLQVSPPVASVLFLYATGLYLKPSNKESNGASPIFGFFDNVEKQQILTDSLGVLDKYFHISSYGNKVSFKPEIKERDSSFEVLESVKDEASKHVHGNISMSSYIDALEYLCLLLVEYATAMWEHSISQDRAAFHSNGLNYVQDALHQFCDSFLAFECTKTSERDQKRLHDSRKTVLQVAVSALKISLGHLEIHKKNFSYFERIISSAWIEPSELKYFISVLGNVAASLYNTGQLEQASAVLELRCTTILTHVKLLCKMHLEKPNGSHGDNLSEDEIRSVIVDASEMCALIVNVLHKCHASNVYKITVKSLVVLSTGEDMFPNLSGSLALVKQWVKMLCKDFENVDNLEKVPYLYSLLSSYSSSCSKKILGTILEQELLAYGLMESQNPDLCQKMQVKVIETLLNDVLTTVEYYVQRSRILIMKARALRTRGMEGINNCNKCLRDAISLLQEISGNLSTKNVPICNQLALIYILAAQCTQEANQDREVILQDVCHALELWSSIGIQDFQGHYPENGYFELLAPNTVRLLCSIIDLLSMKGCWELQFGICKLIFKIFKCGNAPVEKCLAMLWSERRMNHSLCSSPINEDSILEISQHLDSQANSVEFWTTRLKDYPSILLAFIQKFSLSDSILPEINLYSERDCGSIAVDEVKRVASSLISEIPLSSQSASIAGYLYYDLSERLISRGQLFEALSHARVALWLRKKLLRRKFFYSSEHKFAEPVHLAVANQNQQDTVCPEIIGSVATELWPDSNKPNGLENSILTPWSILRGYLESTLQVGIINESVGNGAEAEVLFLTGKGISSMQDLPIFQIAFTSLLGQLYRKNQFLDLAENKLNSARNLLQENEIIISCKRCKLAFDVFIDMQFGDLCRNHREVGDPIQLSSSALQLYRKALDKLNDDELASSLNRDRKTKAETCRLNMQDAHYGALNSGKIPSTEGEVRLPACNICSSSTGDVHHNKQLHQGNMNNKGLSINGGTRKCSRFQSKCTAKEQDLNAELNPKTRFSKKNSHNKRANVTDRLDINDVRIADYDICSDTLAQQHSQSKHNGNSTDSGCKKECMYNTIKCWRCFLIKSTMDGTMQNIIYLKWECHRRRLRMRLLLKIAKRQGIHCGKNKAHGVHDQFCQCISVMFNQHPTSRGSSVVNDFYLIELTRVEDSREIFPVEKALLLYNMSWFFLKDRFSENSRMKCCTLSHFQACDVVPWLLKAFILSRELPLLFQKVSKLLSIIYLMSTVDGSISVPCSSQSLLSTSHWAAFFHQASIGTYLPYQYLACLEDKACFPNVSEDPCSTMLDAVVKASNFLRFAPDRLEYLEEFVREFFQSLPSVPIICISFLEGDYANLIGENLLLPSFSPVWMLLSRLNAASQPIAILLPVDRILDVPEVQLESVKEWQCPWSYSVVDYVAPVFKQLLRENFLSTNLASTSMDTRVNNSNWWLQRNNLNDRLNIFLKSMEDSWLGPWACLLLGELSNPNDQSKIVAKLINELKLQCKVEANDSLISVILGGSKSIADIEACISQLLLYRGYFGRAACSGEKSSVFSNACPKGTRSLPDSIYKLLLKATVEIGKQSNREPIILVMDSDVQMLPWENLPTLRRREVYRMPSVGSISLTLRRCSYHKKHNKGADFPLVNPSDTYYLLNPSGDCGSIQVEFEQWFRSQNWEGEAGKVPSAAELALALQNHDLFLYFGHGSGMQYIPPKEIQKLNKCAATLLMGCSSGTLTYKGCCAPRGAPLSCLFAGSPLVIANLWDVTDKDIDRFGKAMVKSWIEEEPSDTGENCTCCNQLGEEFGCLEIDGGSVAARKTRRKAPKGKKLQHFNDESRCKACGPKRMASFVSQARDACKLPFLIGAAPVCYGVPTLIKKKA